jgi:hypothetical protein
MKYEIESQVNGTCWLITRRADNARLFLQGDDALTFGQQLESTSESYSEDDVCEQYDEVFHDECDDPG